VLLYLNSQSIVNKINELACVVSETKPDILLVTESWCHSGITSAYLTVPGYQLQPDLRVDRVDTVNGAGGGLLVYSPEGLDILPCDQTKVFNQYVNFKVMTGSVTTTIYLFYRPPNSPDMAGLTDIVKNVGPNSLLIGDFNLPSIDWDNGTANNKERPFLEATEEKFLTQLVDFPTQVKGNILDLVLTNAEELVDHITPMGRLGKSDHEMLKITLSTGQQTKQANRTLPDWNRAVWDGMRQHLASIDWYITLRGMDTETAWQKIKSTLQSLTSDFVPVKQQRPPNKPIWMNREIARAMDKKRRLWRRRAPAEEYQAAEKKVRNLIRNAKRNFEKKLAKSNGNSKPFYSYLKNKTKSRAGIGPLQRADGTLTSNNAEMAGILNSFFSSVFTPEVPGAEVPTEERPPNIEVLSNIHFKVEDTRKLILKMKTAGSPGPDKITTRMLQQIAWEIAPALTTLFRKSFAEGTVPTDWRTANVTPIHKKGKKCAAENYRPVSLTSICGKLMEGHVKKALITHLERNNLIKSSQHGFMPGKSCTTNLLHFLEVLTKAADDGLDVDVVFLDFSKAFDKVPHNKLISKLETHGICGKLKHWIKSWLAGRQQRVVVNGEESGWEAVKSGVPQGSLLGPCLFSIYINDIDLLVALITLLLKFADDTKLANIIKGEEDRRNLQACLDALMAWADRWGMAFNTAKCKIMHLGRHNPRYQYKMGDQVLETTELERDIGVLVNNNLKPSEQCAKAARTANAVLGQIARAFHYRDRWTFVRLYKLYVRPHLEFAVAAWSPWTAADIECLEKVQIRAINMVSGLGGMGYTDRLKELKLTTLTERRAELDMVEVYKMMTGISKVDYQTWFTKPTTQEGQRVTRLAAGPLNVIMPASRLELRRNFFSVRACEKWNSLPQEVKSAKSVKCFKNAYRHYQNNRP